MNFKLYSLLEYRVLFEDKKSDKAEISSKAKDLIRLSKIEIHKSISFFSKLLMSIDLIEDWSIRTMCTNGIHIRYNPRFTLGLTLAECVFVLMHEMMHIVFLHFARMKGRDPKKWNYATDYAINILLNDKTVSDNFKNNSGAIVLKMPEGGLLNEKYRGLSAEKIYDMDPKNPNKPKPKPKPKQDEKDKPKVNDYIKIKSGGYGKISAINGDGTYKIDKVSDEEALANTK